MSTKRTGFIKLFLISACIALLILPIILFVGAHKSHELHLDSSGWLITRHYDPKSVPLGFDTMDDNWSVHLAGEFHDLFEDETIEKKFAEIRDVAKDLGYDEKELRDWLYKTSLNADKFPILEATLQGGKKVKYRDLSRSGFPKAKSINILINSFKEVGVVKGILYISLAYIFIALLVLPGTSLVWIFISKQLPIYAKVVFIMIISLFSLALWIQHQILNQPFLGPAMSFYSSGDDYLVVSGQWRGINQELAFPENASKIICERDKGLCREIEAVLSNRRVLMVDERFYPIKEWNNKEIVLETSSNCTTTKTLINFRDEEVTQIRTSKVPLPDNCFTTSEKFITEMVDGIRYSIDRRKKK